MPCQNTNVTQSAIAAMGIIPLTIQASPADRLAHFQKVTMDWWVLNTVNVYEIEFSLKPHQSLINAPHFKMQGIHMLKIPSPKVSKDRHQGCILFCPDKQRAQEISVQRQVLPVKLSPFQLGLSPMGLYQDLKADSSSRSGAGDTVDILHRLFS